MSDVFEVDSGVPIPAVGAGARRKYPFRTMEVGQSFFVPLVRIEGESKDAMTKRWRALQSVVYSSARHTIRRSPGTLFTVRLRVEDGRPGVRAWRVE